MLIGCAAFLHAESSLGIILYASGTELSIYRDGALHSYQLGYESAVGEPVYSGDMVQTGDATFVEIQLAPSNNVIKVAENTTFELTNLEAGGNGSFELTYGRVRARVRQLAMGERFEISGRSASAGVRGTDFGFDLIAQPGGAMAASVYCFEGSVDVNVADAPDPVVVASDEMVSVAKSGKPEPMPVEREIREFWTENDFREPPVDASALESRFPGLKDRVLEERGLELEFLSPAFPPQGREGESTEGGDSAEAGVPAEKLDDAREAAPADDLELAPDATTSEDDEKRFNRAAGWVLTTTGGLLAGGSFALDYVGDDLLPNTPLKTRESMQEGMLLYGSLLVVTGAVSILLNLR